MEQIPNLLLLHPWSLIWRYSLFYLNGDGTNSAKIYSVYELVRFGGKLLWKPYYNSIEKPSETISTHLSSDSCLLSEMCFGGI